MKSELNQMISFVDGQQVGQLEFDSLQKWLDKQVLSSFARRIVKTPRVPRHPTQVALDAWCRAVMDRCLAQLIAASEKAERGGTPQIRNPYTPVGVSLTDLPELLPTLVNPSRKQIKPTRVGGTGVRRK